MSRSLSKRAQSFIPVKRMQAAYHKLSPGKQAALWGGGALTAFLIWKGWKKAQDEKAKDEEAKKGSEGVPGTGGTGGQPGTTKSSPSALAAKFKAAITIFWPWNLISASTMEKLSHEVTDWPATVEAYKNLTSGRNLEIDLSNTGDAGNFKKFMDTIRLLNPANAEDLAHKRIVTINNTNIRSTGEYKGDSFYEPWSNVIGTIPSGTYLGVATEKQNVDQGIRFIQVRYANQLKDSTGRAPDYVFWIARSQAETKDSPGDNLSVYEEAKALGANDPDISKFYGSENYPS